MNLQVDDEVIETAIEGEQETEVLDRGDDFAPEVAAEEAPAKAEDDARPASMIPKARFDEVNNAKKHAEQENARLLAELEALRTGTAPASQQPPVAAQPAPAEPEAQDTALADLEDQYTDALMDGDKDKAREIRMEINAIVSAEAEARALHKIESRDTLAKFEQSIDEAVSTVIGQYPQFDDTGEQANPDAIEAMVAMRNHYITEKGMSAAQAIVAAANKVAAMYSFSAGAEPAVDPRTRAAIKRGAEVSNAQPNTSAVGVGTRADAGKISIHDMNEDQFDALPEAEKRRLRGD